MQKEDGQKIIHDAITKAWGTLKPLVGNSNDDEWGAAIQEISNIANGMPDGTHVFLEEIKPILAFIRAPQYPWLVKQEPIRSLPFEEQVQAATAVYMLRIAEAIGGVKEWT